VSDACWIELDRKERTLLLDALAALRNSNLAGTRDIADLRVKLKSSHYPQITVGVHGEQVQWTSGNPFPIRVCDYDGASVEDLPDVDERGEPCRIWWEPADGPRGV
jgi:hypothetical protein